MKSKNIKETKTSETFKCCSIKIHSLFDYCFRLCTVVGILKDKTMAYAIGSPITLVLPAIPILDSGLKSLYSV